MTRSAALEWVAALDDLLTQRLSHCTLCGQETGARVSVGIQDLPRQRCVAYSVCPMCCQRRPTWQADLVALLEARYRDGKGNADA
jgi:hypothetical protein